MMKKSIIALFLILALLSTTGCIQKSIALETAFVEGRIVVPAGKLAIGCKIKVAGTSKSTYSKEDGSYTFEFSDPGRYLIVARGANFDINYTWVDVELRKTVTAPDIVLNQKLVGEAQWIATAIDFPDMYYDGTNGMFIEGIKPVWPQSPMKMYDDGTHGDQLANDGIYTLRMTSMSTGYQQYSFQYTKKDGATVVNTRSEPYEEGRLEDYPMIYIPESQVKLAKGRVVSDLANTDYSEVTLSSKKASRSIKLNSDGSYSFTMEGNGREYLVFRSLDFDIRAIPVDLSTMTVLEVPDVSLSSKRPGELVVMLVASDFAAVRNPTVVGDFTNWQPRALYDDGTNGDEVAGDGVFSLKFTGLAPGYKKYAFGLDLSDPTSQVRDPYQESGDETYSIVLVK